MNTESKTLINVFPSPRARKRGAKWRLAQMIKLERGCVDCGYNKHAIALQFDHISDDKKDSVSNLIRTDYAWSTIMKEIDKCEVVCANCHAIRTRNRKCESDEFVVLSLPSDSLVFGSR
jgi:hypothetical protein